MSNMMALHLARFKQNNSVKTKGNHAFDKPLIVLTSDEAHYSIQKAANVMGIGTDNVWKVQTDDYGRMRPDKLEEEISRAVNEGKLPVMVNATSGTTVLGAYDLLVEIADICEKHKIWMHVDVRKSLRVSSG